ncbi:Uncharacterised protein [Legionella cherrii]|uniref:Uncharacterized protein n=1 Tax=Legionella cherrii TaxID=28084 RepID=A0ABY6T5R3_9GAMM|nr:Uncharacterised protein [Legionella cherrii]
MSNVQQNFILKVHNLIDIVILPLQDPFSEYAPGAIVRWF